MRAGYLIGPVERIQVGAANPRGELHAYGAVAATTLAAFLVSESARFVCEPEPHDCYRFSVREDAIQRIESWRDGQGCAHALAEARTAALGELWQAQHYADRVAALDGRSGALPCRHGHLGCAVVRQGACMDEALSTAEERCAELGCDPEGEPHACEGAA